MFITLLGIILIAYAAVAAYLYVRQRELIYLPDKNIAAPENYGLQHFVEETVTGSGGLRLQLWYHRPAPGFPTILYFHGNASHMGNRAGIYAALTARGFGLLALSYRGYGKSEGSPSEEGLYEDARTAIRFLTGSEQVPLNHIMLYGESLGTGVAVRMASEFKVGALILQSPYTSVAGRAAELYYYIPVKWLIKDKFDSLNTIPRVSAPVLIFHGELDDTIPLAHGKAIFDAANAPKQYYFFPTIEHNNFDTGIISSHVLDFARKHHLITP